MSGGVDSSVVVALLQQKGYLVSGVTMQLYDSQVQSCSTPDHLHDAQKVASTLNISLQFVDHKEIFKNRIVDYFIDEYRRGRTPSPCILCNNHLKFGALFQYMRSLNGSFLATGHYAQIKKLENGRFALLRGKDPLKDQSYFLFGIQREQLPYIQFPLGGLTKPEVRTLAQQFNLPTAKKTDSQDLCFISGNYAELVGEHLSEEQRRPGVFRLLNSQKELGKHTGIHQFTIGQRRGLRISHSEPLYVAKIDPESGTIWVATRDQLGEQSFEIERCNWLRWLKPPASFRATVKIRSRHTAQPCHVQIKENDRVEVVLDTKDDAITPGQAAVFYGNEEVLGGGWIC